MKATFIFRVFKYLETSSAEKFKMNMHVTNIVGQRFKYGIIEA